MAALADLVEETVVVAGRALGVARPRDADELLDEEAFEREERLPYWAELWPSARALADDVGVRALHGARVLELGCGLGLVSLAAALAGGRVLATDWSQEALALTQENAERNALAVEVAVCDWRAPAPVVARGPWDLVVASDVLYEQRNVALLLDLLPQLVTERGEVRIADPDRRPAARFLEAAPARGWQVRSGTLSQAPQVLLHRLSRGGV